MKNEPTIYEHYETEDVKGEKIETDLFEFTLDGEIVKWSVYSHFLGTFCEMPLNQYKEDYESKFDRIQDVIDCKCADIITEKSESYILPDEAS